MHSRRLHLQYRLFFQDEASEIISGQDFYQTAYGVIFDSMIELFNEGKPVDLITLQERLKEKDVPPEIAESL